MIPAVISRNAAVVDSSQEVCGTIFTTYMNGDESMVSEYPKGFWPCRLEIRKHQFPTDLQQACVAPQLTRPKRGMSGSVCFTDNVTLL